MNATSTASQTQMRIQDLTDRLRSSLTNSTILTPGAEGYGESIERRSETIKNHAAIVVHAQSAFDISVTILLCRKYSIPFAVAGGRHATSDASSCDGGVVIDLCRMRRVTVEPETKLIKVQGGCIWKDVDETAAEYGLAMVGGTVNDTGVGGLTLGGGYGWLSGRYGLAIDSLIVVQMVLADGSIVLASKEQYPDLFWGVRGAGQCLGVAVEFTFQVYEQINPVWAGQMGFPIAKLEAVVEFANDLVATTDGDSAVIIQISTRPFTNGELAVIVGVFHNGGEESAMPIFQPLLDLNPLMNTVVECPYAEVNGIMNPKAGRGARSIYKGAAFATPLRPSFVKDVLVSKLQRLHALVPGSEKTMLLLEFFKPDKWCEVPVIAAAHGHRGYFQNLMIAPRWNNPEDDQRARHWALDTANLVAEEQERRRREGGLPEEGPLTEYGNYDHLSARPRNIFGKNLDRLIEVKKQYDPDNVFNKSYALLEK